MRGTTNLSRPWSGALPFSFPRRQEDATNINGGIDAFGGSVQQQRRPQLKGLEYGGSGDIFRTKTSVLQPRRPRGGQQQQHQKIRIALACGDGGGGWGAPELVLPPVSPLLLPLVGQHCPRKSVFLRQLRRRRLLKRLLATGRARR